MTVRPSKMCKTVRPSAPQIRGKWKTRHQRLYAPSVGFFTFFLAPRIRLTESASAQAQVSWEPVTPPGRLTPAARPPWPPWAPPTPPPGRRGRGGRCSEPSRLPDKIIGAMSDRFRVTREGGRPPYSERRAGRGIHAFLDHLASGADPVPGLECLTLLGVRPGRNGAPPEIVFLRPRRPIF